MDLEGGFVAYLKLSLGYSPENPQKHNEVTSG
jgi:hypothetical protein